MTVYQQSLEAMWMLYRVNAMIATRDKLFVSGPPDVVDPQDPLGAFEGRKGGLLWVLSKSDGKKLAEYTLDSPPVFDGMAVAGKRLYIATQDGRMLCFGQQTTNRTSSVTNLSLEGTCNE